MPQLKVNAQLSKEDLLEAAQQLNANELEQFTKQILSLNANKNAPSLSKTEANLILNINQPLDSKVQQRYEELTEKRNLETIDEEEYSELLDLTEQVEDHQAQRLEYLAELAQLRQISLTQLVKQLGIEPIL